MTAERALAAVLLAAFALPSGAIELSGGADYGAGTAWADGQRAPSQGVLIHGALTPLTFVLGGSVRTAERKPADLQGSWLFGVGFRTNPWPWASLEVLGIAASQSWTTTDVNLRGWYGPTRRTGALGARVQATAGPRLGQPTEWVKLRPFVGLAWTSTFARRDHDRLRTWGGPVHGFEASLGVEFIYER